MKLTLAFALLVLSLSNLSFAGPVKTLNLTTAEGVSIQIAYEETTFQTYGCFRCNIETRANPMIITVTGADLSQNDQVRIVIKNHNTHEASPGLKFLDLLDLDLKATEEGSFTSTLKDLTIHSTGYGGVGTYNQELTIEINGSALKNASDNSSNFRFNLF